MDYKVKGSFRKEGKNHPFVLTIDAVNENVAKDIAYSRIGSNHKCSRRFIKVEGVSVASE